MCWQLMATACPVQILFLAKQMVLYTVLGFFIVLSVKQASFHVSLHAYPLIGA